MHSAKLIHEIEVKISATDSSFYSFLSIKAGYKAGQGLSPKQRDYLQSLHRRVISGEDGLYTPKGALTDESVISNLLRVAKANKKIYSTHGVASLRLVLSIEDWYNKRGFITAKQAAALRSVSY